MKTGKTDLKIKRRIRSFVADEDVDLLLSAAQQDNVPVASVCNAALRKHGKSIIFELLAQAGTRAAKWIDNFPNVRAAQKVAAYEANRVSSEPLSLPVDAAGASALKSVLREPPQKPATGAPSAQTFPPTKSVRRGVSVLRKPQVLVPK